MIVISSWTPRALTSRHFAAENIHPAIAQSALRSLSSKDAHEKEQALIRSIDRSAWLAWEAVLDQLPAADDAINKAIIDDALTEVVVPYLTEEEIEWIRGIFLSTQALCLRVHALIMQLKCWAPVLTTTLDLVRQVTHDKKHKLLRYIFDGKGAYLKEHTTVYNISGIFEPAEYEDANGLFVGLRRATVKKQVKPTDYRYDAFVIFVQDFN